MTPASSIWRQSWEPKPELEQFRRDNSLPRHAKSSRMMGVSALPGPKPAICTASEPEPHSTKIKPLEHVNQQQLCNVHSSYILGGSSLPSGENPSCVQTTVASWSSHMSSHTVPYRPPMHTSTRPSYTVLPPTNLTDPNSHVALGTGERERE